MTVKHSIMSALVKKAKKSIVTYKISAIALDDKGDIIGQSFNSPSDWLAPRKGAGHHAERVLMSRYGKNIKTIVICRVGNGGELLPIDPCDCCKKVADKLGIKIYSVMPGVKG